MSPPVITNDDILVGCKDQFVSLEKSSGKTNWVLKTPGESYISRPWRTTVFVGTGTACWAVDVHTGEIKWIYEMTGPVTAPPGVSSQGNVFVGSWDTYLYALEGKTGKNMWMFPTGWGIDITPSEKDNRVFFGSLDNNFYAVDSSTGDYIWSYTCQAGIHSSPLIYGDYVFFGSDDGRFYALNQTTGKPAWSFTPGYSLQGDVYTYLTTPLVSHPVVSNRTIFLGVKGKLYALDAQTSEQIIDAEQSFFDVSSFTNTRYIMVPVALALGAAVLLTSFYWHRKKGKRN